MPPQVSVIIPTHNRPDKVAATVACLQQQTLSRSEYEIIVVDDGSRPPVLFPKENADLAVLVLRLEGVERSAARNAGAAAARAALLVFVDDDLSLSPSFLESHVQAAQKWPGALQVGAIRLPPEIMSTPFGRFRQRLEDSGLPQAEGLVNATNFCTAGNMAIEKVFFDRLGGFEATILCGEDQDLALRFTSAGGKIVYVPAALAIHHDDAFDIRSYCRRSAWGSENLIAFCRRYVDRPDTIERERVNGFHDWKLHSVAQGLRKAMKSVLASRPAISGLFCLADALERTAPNGVPLDWTYRLLLGAHIFRGFRTGLRRFGPIRPADRAPLRLPAPVDVQQENGVASV